MRNEIGVSIQRTVFLNSGVIIPQIEIVDDAKIPFGHWALEVGTSGLPALTGESTWAISAEADMAIVSAILSRAGDLMGPASVDHQLDFLDRAAPALIFCVRSLLPMPVLLAALRLRLEEKNSNLGLLGLLEDWVIDWGEQMNSSGRAS